MRHTFQRAVDVWMQACFGITISKDRRERNYRFLEEALELVQALDCTKEDAHALVEYVFGRPVGEPRQEVGGVMVTLAALCTAAAIDAEACGDEELARVWTMIERIREKQQAKRIRMDYSPLP
jgi:NTP pyrophosphatase (non-canonical NTP hydrolase)